MSRLSWGVGYLLALFRQSWPVWLAALAQGYILLGSPQIGIIINRMGCQNEWDLSRIGYLFFLSLTGILQFSGVYWFHFWSFQKSGRYQEPSTYTQSHQKIKAWQYQEFLSKYRNFFIRWVALLALIQTEALLIFQWISGRPIPGMDLAVVSGTHLLFLWMAWNRRTFLVKKLRMVLSALSLLLEGIWDALREALIKQLVPRSVKPIDGETEIWPKTLTTEEDVTGFRQASPAIRGGFYGLLLTMLVLFVVFQTSADSFGSTIKPLGILLAGICIWHALLWLIQLINRFWLLPAYLVLGIFMAWVLWPTEIKPNQSSGIPNFQTTQVWEARIQGWVHSGNSEAELNMIRSGKKARLPMLIIGFEGKGISSMIGTATQLQALELAWGQSLHKALFLISGNGDVNAGIAAYIVSQVHSVEKRSGMLGFSEGDPLSRYALGWICGNYSPKSKPEIGPEGGRSQWKKAVEAWIVSGNHSKQTRESFGAWLTMSSGSNEAMRAEVFIQKKELLGWNKQKAMSYSKFVTDFCPGPMLFPSEESSPRSSGSMDVIIEVLKAVKQSSSGHLVYPVVMIFQSRKSKSPAFENDVFPINIADSKGKSRVSGPKILEIKEIMKSLNSSDLHISDRLGSEENGWFLDPKALAGLEHEIGKGILPDFPKLEPVPQKHVSDTTQKAKTDSLNQSSGKERVIKNKSGIEEDISLKTHPHLFYYSVRLKKWRRISEADFNTRKLKPLSKRKRKRLNP